MQADQTVYSCRLQHSCSKSQKSSAAISIKNRTNTHPEALTPQPLPNYWTEKYTIQKIAQKTAMDKHIGFQWSRNLPLAYLTKKWASTYHIMILPSLILDKTHNNHRTNQANANWAACPQATSTKNLVRRMSFCAPRWPSIVLIVSNRRCTRSNKTFVRMKCWCPLFIVICLWPIRWVMLGRLGGQYGRYDMPESQPRYTVYIYAHFV